MLVLLKAELTEQFLRFVKHLQNIVIHSRKIIADVSNLVQGAIYMIDESAPRACVCLVLNLPHFENGFEFAHHTV